MSTEETTNNEIIAELQRLARGNAGYEFRGQLRDRYLSAFRAANKTDNVPRVMYLNGWWELPHGGRRRTADFIRMILQLEERASANDRSQSTEGTHIRFVSTGIREGQETERWNIETKEDEDLLGEVKWFGQWRRYSFFPHPGCVFEETCMREISNFIEERTRAHRTRKLFEECKMP